jgi:hypothetical protein
VQKGDRDDRAKERREERERAKQKKDQPSYNEWLRNRARPCGDGEPCGYRVQRADDCGEEIGRPCPRPNR